MIRTNITKSDIFNGILTSIFSSYFLYVLIWLVYFVGGSYLYFSTDMDAEMEMEYVFLDSHYTFDDGEMKYHFNIIDLSEEDIEDQKQTIEVTEEEYNNQCDQETFCKVVPTIMGSFVSMFLFFGCIILCFIEGNYLGNHKWRRFKTHY